MILGADGKDMTDPKKPCPKCGAGPDRRTQSGGFGGEIYLVCLGWPGTGCGYEFKELTWQPVLT